MSYEKNTWEIGDTITAEKLNNMEDGIEGAGIVVVNLVDGEDHTFVGDMTYSELTATLGKVPVIARYVIELDGLLMVSKTALVHIATGTITANFDSSLKLHMLNPFLLIH